MNIIKIGRQIITSLIFSLTLFVGLGVIISWVLFGRIVWDFFQISQPFWAWLILIVLGILFILVLPFMFFWKGKDYGLQKVAWHTEQKYKTELHQFIGTQIMAHQDTLKHAQNLQQGLSLKGISFPLRLMINFVLNKLHLDDILDLIKDVNISDDSVAAQLQTKLDRTLVQKPRYTAFWGLLIIEILLFSGSKLVF